MVNKVALITGGASGMGLAVATVLTEKGWRVALVDYNVKAGEAAEKSLPGSIFIKCDVSSWTSLSSAFDATFEKFGTIDFVFANAGIVERDNFYRKQDTSKSRVPPEPNLLTIDINLRAVITTSWLAQHYFRLSPHKGKDAVLIMTASAGGLYPSQFNPIYAATKSGVVNFMRSISFPYRHYDGIRVYATCPGFVRTNLLDSKEWSSFPPDYFTPMESITKTVDLLVTGGDLQDSTGKRVEAAKAYGLAVEINSTNIYFRDQPEYCDEKMRIVMDATKMENQEARLNEYTGGGGQ